MNNSKGKNAPKLAKPFIDDSWIVAMQAIVVSLLVNVLSQFDGLSALDWVPLIITVIGTGSLQYYIYLKGLAQSRIRLEVIEREYERKSRVEYDELQMIRNGIFADLSRRRCVFEYTAPITIFIAFLSVIWINRISTGP